MKKVIFIILFLAFPSICFSQDPVTKLSSVEYKNGDIIEIADKGATLIDSNIKETRIWVGDSYIGKTPLYIKINTTCVDEKDLILEATLGHADFQYGGPCSQQIVLECGSEIPDKISFDMHKDCGCSPKLKIDLNEEAIYDLEDKGERMNFNR